MENYVKKKDELVYFVKVKKIGEEVVEEYEKYSFQKYLFPKTSIEFSSFWIELKAKRTNFNNLLKKFKVFMQTKCYESGCKSGLTVSLDTGEVLNESKISAVFEPLKEGKLRLTETQIRVMQAQIFYSLHDNGRILQGSECGFGKTRVDVGTILFLMSNSFVKFVVIVCPLNLQDDWQKEIDLFCQTIKMPNQIFSEIGKVFARQKSKDYLLELLQRGGFLFSTFESAKKLNLLVDILKEKQKEKIDSSKILLLCDESHNIKSWESRSESSKTLYSLSHQLSKVIFNSGTFFNENFENFSNQMKAFSGDKSISFTTIQQFEEKHFNFLRERTYFSFQRYCHLVILKMTPKLKNFYCTMLSNFPFPPTTLEKIRKLHEDGYPESLPGLDSCRHQQFCELAMNAPDSCFNRSETEFKRMLTIPDIRKFFYSVDGKEVHRDPQTCMKLYLAYAWVKLVVSKNESGIIFVDTVSCGEFLLSGLNSETFYYANKEKKRVNTREIILIYSGADPNRDKVLESFKASTEPRILIMLEGVGQAGHNLEKANRVLNFVVPRELVTLIQSPYRVIRRTQTKPVSVIQFAFEDSLDCHWMVRNILPKLCLHRQLMDNYSMNLQNVVKSIKPESNQRSMQSNGDIFLEEYLELIKDSVSTTVNVSKEMFG